MHTDDLLIPEDWWKEEPKHFAEGGVVTDEDASLELKQQQVDAELMNTPDDIGDAWAKRVASMDKARRARESGEINIATSTLSHAGDIAGGIWDTVGEVGEAAIDVAQLGAQATFPTAYAATAEALTDAGKEILDSDIGKLGLETAEDIYNWYQGFKKENPWGAKSIESVANIAPLAAVGKVVKHKGDKVLEGEVLPPISTYKYKPNSDTPLIDLNNTERYQYLNSKTQGELNNVNKLFNPDVINKALQGTDKNTKVIYMSPGEFLTLAKTHTSSVETKKLDRVNKAISKGVQLEDIPTLTMKVVNGTDSKVTNHDGRHRANAFQEMGYKLIPVRVVTEGRTDKKIHTVTNEDGLEVYSYPNSIIYNRAHLGEAATIKKASNLFKDMDVSSSDTSIIIGSRGKQESGLPDAYMELDKTGAWNTWVVNNVGVAPKYLNQKVGKRMYLRAIEEALENNVDYIDSDGIVSSSAIRTWEGLKHTSPAEIERLGFGHLNGMFKVRGSTSGHIEHKEKGGGSTFEQVDEDAMFQIDLYSHKYKKPTKAYDGVLGQVVKPKEITSFQKVKKGDTFVTYHASPASEIKGGKFEIREPLHGGDGFPRGIHSAPQIKNTFLDLSKGEFGGNVFKLETAIKGDILDLSKPDPKLIKRLVDDLESTYDDIRGGTHLAYLIDKIERGKFLEDMGIGREFLLRNGIDTIRDGSERLISLDPDNIKIIEKAHKADDSVIGQVGETQPTIAFHSTNQKFDTFDSPEIGYHFANNPKLAQRASEKSGKQDTQQLEYELDIKNPLVIKEANLSPSGWSAYQLLDNIDELGLIKTQKEYDKILDDLYKIEDDFGPDNKDYAHEIKRYFKTLLGDKGYDSIKWWNEYDASPTMGSLSKAKWDDELGGFLVPGEQLKPDWSYIVFSNKQIKRKTSTKADDGVQGYSVGGVVSENDGGSTEYTPRNDVFNQTPLINGRQDVYGAAVLGDDESTKFYKNAIEQTANAWGITPQSMHFNQNVNVNFSDGPKKPGSTATATTSVNRDNSTIFSYWGGNNDIADVYHEMPHSLSRRLATMDATGGQRTLLPDRKHPNFGITSYGRNESKQYTADYNNMNNRKERSAFFTTKILNNKAFKMRQKLKTKVAHAVGLILSDPATAVRTEWRRRRDEGTKKEGYYNRPEEIWARAMTDFATIKQALAEGHEIFSATPKGKNYKDTSKIFIRRTDSKDRTASQKNIRIDQETFDAIQQMVDEFKQEKYTISKNDTTTQMKALSLNA